MGHSHLTWKPICMRLLGDYPDCHKDSPSLGKKTWFNNNMPMIPANADEETLKRYARAYNLQLLGLTLFSELSGSSVPLHFLLLFENLDTIRQYSWGSAALAYLYKLGAYALWEAEVKWHGPKNYIGVPKSSLLFYRDEFQRMQIADFIWRPYDERLFHLLNPDCLEGRQSWRAVVPLICFNVIEWHHPGRVMRQYGCRQIPMWYNRVQNLVDGEASDFCDSASLEYYGRYSMITRRLIQRMIEEGVEDAVVVEDAVEAEDNSPQQIQRTQPYHPDGHFIPENEYETLESFGEAGVLDVDPDTIAFDAGPDVVAEEENYGNPNIDSFVDDRYRPPALHILKLKICIVHSPLHDLDRVEVLAFVVSLSIQP
ncbi:hypothetical protein QQ045_012759 [Rhodiola kirilowii]